MSEDVLLGRMGLIFEPEHFGVPFAPTELTPELWEAQIEEFAAMMIQASHREGLENKPPVFPQARDAIKSGKRVMVEIRVVVMGDDQ